MEPRLPIEVYCIDADGYFTGRTDLADPCPETLGEWLIPAGCVPMPPPTHDMAVLSMRWDGFRWVPEPARRRGQPSTFTRLRAFFVRAFSRKEAAHGR